MEPHHQRKRSRVPRRVFRGASQKNKSASTVLLVELRRVCYKSFDSGSTATYSQSCSPPNRITGSQPQRNSDIDLVLAVDRPYKFMYEGESVPMKAKNTNSQYILYNVYSPAGRRGRAQCSPALVHPLAKLASSPSVSNCCSYACSTRLNVPSGLNRMSWAMRTY